MRPRYPGVEDLIRRRRRDGAVKHRLSHTEFSASRVAESWSEGPRPFGLWRVCFPPVLIRPDRRLLV